MIPALIYCAGLTLAAVTYNLLLRRNDDWWRRELKKYSEEHQARYEEMRRDWSRIEEILQAAERLAYVYRNRDRNSWPILNEMLQELNSKVEAIEEQTHLH